MKKLFLTLGVAAMLVTGGTAQGNEIVEKVVMYLPNRVMDTLDSFTVTLGFGPTIRAELMATRAVVVGAGWTGWVGKLYKDYNRQYGIGIQEGWYWSAIVGEEDMRRDRTLGWVKSYWEARAGFPDPIDRIYEVQDGARDYWQFGGALGFLIEGEVYIHPLEGVDWLLGFFFIDIKGDDLTFDDIR